jgi:hypothetical protein
MSVLFYPKVLACSQILIAVLCLAIPSSLHAQSIILSQPAHFFDGSVENWAPMGQTFQAPNSQLLTAAFWFWDNGLQVPPGRFTYELREGEGAGGKILTSTSFVLTAPFKALYETPLPYSDLEVGGKYTIMVQVENKTWGVGWMPISSTPGEGGFLGGYGVFQGRVDPFIDTRFKFVFAPEPSPFSLCFVAATCFLVWRFFRLR